MRIKKDVIKLNKKEKKIHLKEIEENGIALSYHPRENKKDKIEFLLLNALLDFLIVMGTLGVFLEAFEIKTNMPMIIMSSMIISLAMAFMYINNIIRILGYLGVLVIFIQGVMNNAFRIRGGFSYIINDLMRFFEFYLGLQIEREYDTYGFEKNSAVLFSLIFIIFSVTLMINMSISESKNFVFIFLVTFPIVQMGMYFNRTTSLIYFTMYMIGILGLFFFRGFGHYRMETKKRRGYFFKHVKNKYYYDYTSDSKVGLTFMLAFAMIFLATTLVFGILIPRNNFTLDKRFSSYKENTMDFTKRFILVGFWGMFAENGGIAGGVGKQKLGQSRLVSLDYETDLKLTMAVTKDDKTVYLKDGNGTFYKDAYWYTISEYDGEKVDISDYDVDDENIGLLNYYLAKEYYKDPESEGVFGRSKIYGVSNIGAGSTDSFFPLNTRFSNEDYKFENYSDEFELFKNDDEIDTKYKHTSSDYTYYGNPIIYTGSYDEFKKKISQLNTRLNSQYAEQEANYSEYVKDMYLEVPEEAEDAIKAFCDKYELTKDTPNIEERIAQIFSEDYEYTLMPGVTPSNKEFVSYFLGTQKKGYCVYFATATTLILRYLGIPARYATGYVLWTGDYGSGQEYTGDGVWNEDIEWVDNQSEDEKLYTFELTDAEAHAWVEEYVDGFGWVTVETTPSSEEEELEENNAVTDFLNNNIFTRETYDNVKKFTLGTVTTIVIVGVAGVIILLVTGFIVRVKRKKNMNPIKQYKYLCAIGESFGVKKDETEAYRDYSMRLMEAGVLTEEEAYNIYRIIEKIKFSLQSEDERDTIYVKSITDKTRTKAYEELKFFRKVKLKYIKWI